MLDDTMKQHLGEKNLYTIYKNVAAERWFIALSVLLLCLSRSNERQEKKLLKGKIDMKNGHVNPKYFLLSI